MAIYAPGRRINPTLQRRTAMNRKGVYASLFLTSMVDMFAILVIFLLQSFSSEGELIVLPSGLELPQAHNVGTLEPAPSLIIGKDEITFEGKTVAQTKRVSDQEEWAIPSLQEALKDYRAKALVEQAKHLQALGQNPSEEDLKKATQKINISADRRLEFQVIRKVIYNAGFMGYPDFRFAVFGKGPSSNPQ